jgi:tetratricopeptide (TPR) repeat protein
VNKLRWILIICGVFLVAGLYVFGRTKSIPTGGVTLSMGAMSGGHAGPDAEVNFDAVLKIARNNLPATKLDSLKLLDDRLKESPDKKEVIKSLIKFWSGNGEPAVAGKYLMDIADKTGDSKDWSIAGDVFNITFQQTNDSIIRIFAVQQAIVCYKNAITKDSSNLNNQVKLAQCYVDGNGDVMNGVLILKGLEKKEPDNLQVNLLLGRLDIESGQIDKAVPRLEKLVKNHPSETEAYFYLGMAYKASGKMDKALQTFEKCRKMVTDPDAQKQIDNIIEQLKKS